ncbi:MAG: N-acyl homoserine lactonase family protein [Syntrophomonadaceae bacterium]|nr:N-acyl homoserine lactonase family protein [Syntrophomonadaceae bacterium]
MSSIKGVTTHLLDMMIPLVGPALVFLIEGGAERILVDAGVGGPEALIRALAAKGLKPKDIDTVIITHLHFDHADNVGLFPHARFILQKKEWEYARSPLPIQRSLYDPNTIAELEMLNLVLVEDGFSVVPGVQVILVPGHTQGQQAVVVNTGAGPYVIAGDLLYSYLNIYPEIAEFTDMLGNKIRCTPQPDHDFYPPGIHTDLTEWYKSVERVLSLAGSRERIIPGHDPQVVGKIFPD